MTVYNTTWHIMYLTCFVCFSWCVFWNKLIELKRKTRSRYVCVCLKVQLVFAKEGSQLAAFSWAANKGGYECFTTHTHDSAIKIYTEKRPDVIIIDARCTKYFDAKGICRCVACLAAVAITTGSPRCLYGVPIRSFLVYYFTALQYLWAVLSLPYFDLFCWC